MGSVERRRRRAVLSALVSVSALLASTLGPATSSALASGPTLSTNADQADPSVPRLGGDDRYAVAAAVADSVGYLKPKVVFLAGGMAPADAMAGAPLAGRDGAPVLLTPPGRLSSVAADSIRRIRPQNGVVVLGGPASVSDDVVAELQRTTSVQRIQGPDRYEVAAAIVRSGWRDGASTVYLASGTALTDALAAAPVSAHDRAPLLLTRRDSLPVATREALLRLAPERVVVLGGPSSVSPQVEDELRDLSPSVERVGGDTRYDVATALSTRTFDPGVRVAYLASGTATADALAAGPAAGLQDGPILLTTRTGLPAPVSAELERLRPRRIVVLGGPATLPTTTEDEVRPFVRPGRASALATGGTARVVCAVVAGSVECWGDNALNTLGSGPLETVRIGVPIPVKGLPAPSVDPAVDVDAGGGRACALLASGRVWCWGLAIWGPGGTPDTYRVRPPEQVPGVDHATALTVGSDFSCVVEKLGEVRCWGLNNWLQLGRYPAEGDPLTALPVPNLGGPAVAVEAGDEHACAVLDDGTVRCWGGNDHGESGRDPSGGATRTTAHTVRLGAPASSLALGAHHSCAMLVDGGVRCWGDNRFGALGDVGTTAGSFLPVTPTGLDRARGTLAASTGTCLVVDDGAPWCWGTFIDSTPILGTGVGRLDVPTRVPRLGTPAQQQLTRTWSCLLDGSGRVSCLGNLGYLGVPGQTIADSPVVTAGY